jgi:hypothetical protein
MIRSEVMGWAAIFLIVIFAFVLIPTHERFTDAQGRYTDVSPNAPARPSWMSAPTTGSLVSAGSIRPVDTSTAYSRTAPQVASLGAPMSNIPSAPVVGAGGGVGGGSSSSSTCWGDPVDGDSGNFVSGDSYGKYMSKTMAAVMACYGGSFPPQGTQPTPAQMECITKSSASYTTLDEAKTACSADASCKAVLSQLRGPNGTVYSKYNEDATIGPTGMRNPGMKIYVKKPCGATSSNLQLLSSPTAAAPRVTSTLGTADPSISGMNSAYTSGVIPPTGSPWPGLQTATEMAAEVTNPAFQAQRHPNPPLGTLAPTTPDTGLFGPGPNVLRKNLVSCTCASQAAGCSVHPRQ